MKSATSGTADIDFITDRLATGGDITGRNDIDDLVAAGITHIIDNRIEWSDEELFGNHAPGIVYLHNGVDDAGGPQPRSWYDRGIAFALGALSDPDTKVLTHCHMGINRGPSMAFAILLAEGWDPLAAFDAIRLARPIADIAYADDALRHRLDRDSVPGQAAADALDRLAVHEQWMGRRVRRRRHSDEVPVSYPGTTPQGFVGTARPAEQVTETSC